MRSSRLPSKYSLATFLVLAIGVVATGLGAWHEFYTAEQLDRVRFRELAETVRNDITNRMHTYEYALQSIRCLYQSSEVVTDREFDSSAHLWTSTTDFPGVLGIAYIERVPADPQEPQGNAAEHMIVQNLHSLDGNESWVGHSLATMPKARLACEQAAASGQATLSEQMKLAIDSETKEGFLNLLPVYLNTSPFISQPPSIDSVRGWICIALQPEAVFGDIFDAVGGQVDFQLYDGAPQPQNEFFSSDASSDDTGAGYYLTAPLHVGGREWTIVVSATGNLHRSPRDLAWALLAGGTLVTLLVAYLLRMQSRALQQAMELAEGMTEEVRRLAMVAERTTNGVLITDSMHRILWANKGFSRLCGYRLDEVRGMIPGSFLESPNSDPHMLAEIRRAVADGRPFHGEILSRRKGGEEFWVDLEIQPLFDEAGSLNGFIAIQSDITDRVEAERRARSLANILQEAPNEIYLIDTQTHCLVEANAGASKQLGYSLEKLRGMHVWQFQPEATEEFFRQKCDPLDSGELDKMVFDTNHRRKDGTEYQVHVNLYRTRFEGRDVYVAFVADMTDRLLLEQQLAQSQKLEAIGQLSAGVAHEINTPMQCVVSNVEYLSEVCVNLFQVTDGYRASLKAPAASWDERKKQLEMLEEVYDYDTLRQETLDAIVESAEAANRVVEVVRAMKTMAHPGSNEKTWVDLNEMVRSAVMVSRNRWKYYASLEMALDDSLPCIPLLSNHMNQVLLNLLVNAADAICEQIEHQETSDLGRIEVTTWWESDGVMLRIHDTGCGMTDEVRRRAFDPFFTTKEVGKGTGQGLAISYDVVVLKHGGSIDIESAVGQGTTITLWLPGHSDDAADGTSEQSLTLQQV